ASTRRQVDPLGDCHRLQPCRVDMMVVTVAATGLGLPSVLHPKWEETMRDKTVIVTGGGAGIGRAVVLLCADRGARVAVLDLDGKAGIRVAEEALARGARSAVGIRCDVSIESEIERAVA